MPAVNVPLFKKLLLIVCVKVEALNVVPVEIVNKPLVVIAPLAVFVLPLLTTN